MYSEDDIYIVYGLSKFQHTWDLEIYVTTKVKIMVLSEDLHFVGWVDESPNPNAFQKLFIWRAQSSSKTGTEGVTVKFPLKL